MDNIKFRVALPCFQMFFRVNTAVFSTCILYVKKNHYLCRPKNECGQICLLATTLKNAKNVD